MAGAAWRLTSSKAALTLAPPLESREQAAVVQWANTAAGQWRELRLLFAVPNAAKREPKTIGLLIATGMKAGVPDLWLPVARAGFIGLVIEMKRKPNTPTDEQIAWLIALEAEGWKTAVCYSADEAITILLAYISASRTVIGHPQIVRQ